MSYSNSNELLDATVCKILGAYASSTIRAYRSDFAEYIAYSKSQGLEVFPPNPMILAEFISHLSEKGVSSSTIRRAVAGISTIYRLNRMPDPSKDPEVIISMKRMHRKLGRAARQAQGITREVLQQLRATTDDSERGIRDRALLLVAYDTLCRRSELVSLQIKDIRTVEKNGRQHTIILLRRSKTDQEAAGRWLELSEIATNALFLWLGFVNEMEGPIFRGVSNNHELTRGLGPGQVNRIYKNAARKAQLDEGVVQNISGHSCRVGAAQDLLTAGASLPMIMKKGRWVKTDTVMRYVEHASVTN